MQLAGKTKGFTLVEILIAILILAIVLSTAYASYTGVFRIISNVEEESEIYSMARTFLSRLEKDVHAIVPYTSSGQEFVAEKDEIEGQEFTNLLFRAASHIPFGKNEPQGGVAAIGYQVVMNKITGEYDIMRTDIIGGTIKKDLSEDDRKTMTERSFVVCKGVQSLSFRFIDSKGETHDDWNSGGDVQNQIKQSPVVIIVMLSMRNPANKETPYKFTTKISIPLNKIVSG